MAGCSLPLYPLPPAASERLGYNSLFRGVIYYSEKVKVEEGPTNCSTSGRQLLIWSITPWYSAVCGGLCVSLSITGRKQAIAAACLFSLAIFSCLPCQGPHNHPPTVGSSGLQYNGLQQTTVIHLCHVFIHPVKHTCSCWQQHLTCQKYTQPNEHEHVLAFCCAKQD